VISYVSGGFSVTKANQTPVVLAGSTTNLPGTVNLAGLVSGGSGTGFLGYTIVSGGTASGCQILGSVLSATSAGTCLVMVTDEGDTNYNPATSATAVETFNLGTQATLTLSNTSVALPGTINLAGFVSGGSGSGFIGYTLVAGGTASGCSILGTVLSATSAGTCFVKATKSGDADYNSTTSTVATETFTSAALLNRRP